MRTGLLGLRPALPAEDQAASRLVVPMTATFPIAPAALLVAWVVTAAIGVWLSIRADRELRREERDRPDKAGGSMS